MPKIDYLTILLQINYLSRKLFKMRRIICPVILRKYSWCGILALVFACRLAMPTNKKSFDILLTDFQKILGKTKCRWNKNKDPVKDKKRGRLTVTETKTILDYYFSRCKYTHQVVKSAGVNMNVRKWLKTVKENTEYIVHTGKHAIFVDVGATTSKWSIYDQSGKNTKKSLAGNNGKGSLLRLQIRSVFTVNI